MLTALTVLFAWTGNGGEALATGLAVGFEGIALTQRQNRFVSQQTAHRLLQGILGALALLGFGHLYLGSWLEGGAILMGSIGEALRVPDVPNDERTNTPG